ncbi:MAG TPA: glycosyltransferase family 4 protein [Candidatus Limnocylindria bacterium]|nr:glycosyltransferase family 4 protein [Candidatus Limnocylindria bacterium]
MLAAMRRDGVRVATVVLRGPRDAAQLGELRAPVVLVDTIAASLAARHLAHLRAHGSEVVALAHMRFGAMALARRADRVIAVSHALADELVAGGIDPRRIVVIAPGRDGVAAQPRANRGRRILCVGNWTPTKGIHTLVAAVARVPDVTLDLVGDAPDAAYAARVRRAIAARGLAARVRVHGPLGRAAVRRRYAAASIFALPSTREAYPIVYAEALSHGLPVVGCDIPAVREVVGGAAILVAPGRVAPLAAALKRLITDERSRRDLARQSLLRARRLPTWAESEARFVRAVREGSARGLRSAIR